MFYSIPRALETWLRAVFEQKRTRHHPLRWAPSSQPFSRRRRAKTDQAPTFLPTTCLEKVHFSLMAFVNALIALLLREKGWDEGAYRRFGNEVRLTQIRLLWVNITVFRSAAK